VQRTCFCLAVFLLLRSLAVAAVPAPVRTSASGTQAFTDKTIWAQTLAGQTDAPPASALRAELEYTELSDPHGSLHARHAPSRADAGVRPPAIAGPSGTGAVFVNLYRDFSDGAVRPYLGGGLGLAYDHAMDRDEIAMAGMNGATVSSGAQARDARLAWNAGIGVDMEATDAVRLDFGYRVTGTDGGTRDFRQPAQGAGLDPMLGESPSGAPTHLFSVGISIGF
jgi:opacity protein-like surface antigen